MARLISRKVLPIWMVVASFAVATGSQAQEEPILGWTRGPGTAAIGSNLAEIDLTDAYVFLDADDSQRFMELNRNPVSGAELATVAPISEESNWFIIFEWEDSGYVPDDEKDSLDADAMLESIRTGTEAANKERRERGWPTMSIVGWHEMPHYDARTNNLSWAIVGRGDGGDTINRITKLLGRRGVMTATLVASPDELPSAIPEVDTLLDSYRFRPGSTYAEFVPGKDKLAKYGLTALVVGGAGAALVKSGLLAKIWKPLVVALAAVGAGIKRFFFGGRSSKHDPEKPLV